MITRILIAAVCLILGAAATPALAASSHVFVSGIGRDTGACPQTAPCRSFSYALSQALAGGEIIVVAPGVFSPFTISKSITIANDGVGTAVILAGSNATAITISAGTSGVVEIHGIEIDGQQVAALGIEVQSAAVLQIFHTTIRNVVGFAIDSGDTPNNTSASLTKLVASIDDSYLTGGEVGIALPGHVTISNTKIFYCATGIIIPNNTFENIDNTIISGGGVDGITVEGGFSVVKDSVISGSTEGIVVKGGYVWIGHNIISGNNYGTYLLGGHIITYGDNYINGNTQADIFGTLSTTPVTR